MNQKQHKRSAFFGQDRFRSLRCRRVGGPRQHLALPLSCGQVRRRHLPAHLHHPRLHLRLHHDRGRDGAGPDDQEKPGGRVRLLRQKAAGFPSAAGSTPSSPSSSSPTTRSSAAGSSGIWPITSAATAASWRRTAISPPSFPAARRRRSASPSLPSLPSPSSLRACATAWSGCPR